MIGFRIELAYGASTSVTPLAMSREGKAEWKGRRPYFFSSLKHSGFKMLSKNTVGALFQPSHVIFTRLRRPGILYGNLQGKHNRNSWWRARGWAAMQQKPRQGVQTLQIPCWLRCSICFPRDLCTIFMSLE